MDDDFQPGSEPVLRRYLLGELSDAELEDVEQRLFSDDEYFEHLALVEDDLIDAYVRNELGGRERRRFESHFLSSPRRRERVALTQGWLTPAPVRKETKPAARWWLSPWPALAAAAVVVLATAGMMLRFNGLLSQGRQESAALRREIQDLRKGSTGAPAAVPASFLLTPGVRRDPNWKAQRLQISQTSGPVELVLVRTQPGSYRSYRIVLQNLDGRQIWGGEIPPPSNADPKVPLKSTIPNGVLRPGVYRAIITGVKPSGETEDLDDYYVFEVT